MHKEGLTCLKKREDCGKVGFLGDLEGEGGDALEARESFQEARGRMASSHLPLNRRD